MAKIYVFRCEYPLFRLDHDPGSCSVTRHGSKFSIETPQAMELRESIREARERRTVPTYSPYVKKGTGTNFDIETGEHTH